MPNRVNRRKFEKLNTRYSTINWRFLEMLYEFMIYRNSELKNPFVMRFRVSNHKLSNNRQINFQLVIDLEIFSENLKRLIPVAHCRGNRFYGSRRQKNALILEVYWWSEGWKVEIPTNQNKLDFQSQRAKLHGWRFTRDN